MPGSILSPRCRVRASRRSSSSRLRPAPGSPRPDADARTVRVRLPREAAGPGSQITATESTGGRQIAKHAGVFRDLATASGLSAADVGHLDLVADRGRLGTKLRVAVRPAAPDATQRRLELVVARAAAYESAQVMATSREQARVQLTQRRQPRPSAGLTERLADRGDRADLARAIDIAIALGDLTGVRRVDRLDRPHRADPLDDLSRGYDVVHPPAVGRADVHELDEPDRVAVLATVRRQVEDVVAVVDATLHDRVDLDRAEAVLLRSRDALEHSRHGDLGVADRGEPGRVERVEADRDAAQSGVATQRRRRLEQ